MVRREEMGLNSCTLTKNCLSFFLLVYMANAAAAAKVVDVKNFGAIADGKTDSTKAFLSAWNEACKMKGKPHILIPQGTFFVGPLAFQGPCQGHITMQIKGVLKAKTDLSVFTTDQWISYEHVHGLIITGGGVFDGNGASAWPYDQCSKTKNCKLLPSSIKFSYVTNATIRRIASVDSKSFHIVIDGSKDIEMHNVKITAPKDSPNTDGLHIGDSINIKISRSIIGTGDDCISLGPGSINVTISRVLCGPGHGISVGSLGRYPNEEDVLGLKVSNCTLNGTANGLRIKTWQDSQSSSASDFVFEDVVMNNVLNPIIIDQEYCPYVSCAEKAPSKVKISNIKFHNITGTSASEIIVKLACSKAVPCQDVELTNINLVYSGSGKGASSLCSNVKGISVGHCTPPPCI